MNPRVLIATPITSLKDYCIEDYLKGLKEISYPNKKFFLLTIVQATNRFQVSLKKKVLNA